MTGHVRLNLTTKWLEIKLHIRENKGEGIVADSLELHSVWMFQLLNDSCFLCKRFLIQFVLAKQFLNDDFLHSGISHLHQEQSASQQ